MKSMLDTLEQAVDSRTRRPEPPKTTWEKTKADVKRGYADYLGDAQASTKQNLKRIKEKILAGKEGDDD